MAIFQGYFARVMEDHLSWSHVNLFKILDLEHTWPKFFTFLLFCECLCFRHVLKSLFSCVLNFKKDTNQFCFLRNNTNLCPARSNSDRADKRGTCLSHVGLRFFLRVCCSSQRLSEQGAAIWPDFMSSVITVQAEIQLA